MENEDAARSWLATHGLPKLDADKIITDCLAHGIGASMDGKHIPFEELRATPSHPFTPDVVANARARICVWEQDRAWLPKQEEPISVKAARQILAVVERG